MIVLCAQVEIAHQDRDLSTCQDQDAKDQEQEAKDIVDLVRPDRVHDEVQFDEDRAEGKDTANHHRREGTEIKDLVRDLSRDLVGSDRLLNLWALESQI